MQWWLLQTCGRCSNGLLEVIEAGGVMQVGVRGELGRLALRRRLLEAAGFTVVGLPYWEWEALAPQPLHGRVAYLKQLLSHV